MDGCKRKKEKRDQEGGLNRSLKKGRQESLKPNTKQLF